MGRYPLFTRVMVYELKFNVMKLICARCAAPTGLRHRLIYGRLLPVREQTPETLFIALCRRLSAAERLFCLLDFCASKCFFADFCKRILRFR